VASPADIADESFALLAVLDDGLIVEFWLVAPARTVEDKPAFA